MLLARRGEDYRRHSRTRPSDLADEVAVKVRDTLAGLASAQNRANVDEEKASARRALRADGLRVVLHLEQPTKPSRLFPRAIDPVEVEEDLRRKHKGVDPRALVVETAASAGIPWKIGAIGAP